VAEAGQAVQRADGADHVTDFLTEIGCRLKLLASGGEATGGGRGPGPGLQHLGLVHQRRGEAEGTEGGEGLGCPVGLPGQGQRLRGGGVGPLSGERPPELLEEGIGLAGPAEGAHRPTLFKVQNSEPFGHEGPGFGAWLVDDQALSSSQEVAGLT
jgi:hypothetical protein